jgi:carbonic anhydrase
MKVWGADAHDMPGYREALIESAVCINAAQSAFDLRHEVEREAKWEIEVLYGVHNIRTHQVCMPVDPLAVRSDENVRIALAPTNPREFHTLAIQMAQILKPGVARRSSPAQSEADGDDDSPAPPSGPGPAAI